MYEVTPENLANLRKQSSVTYFYQNNLNRRVGDLGGASASSPVSGSTAVTSSTSTSSSLLLNSDTQIDKFDFHLRSSCQGEFSLQPDGSSSEIISFRKNYGSNWHLNKCYDFSSTKSAAFSIEISAQTPNQNFCSQQANQILTQIVDKITNLGDIFILTLSLDNGETCDCSNDLLVCDSHLTVTETVTQENILKYLENLKLLLELNQVSVNFTPFSNQTYQMLASDSVFLSECLDWVPPENYHPKNDPNWIKPNACCGPKKYHTSMHKCCSRNKNYDLYDDRSHVCCEGMVYPGSRCPVHNC